MIVDEHSIQESLQLRIKPGQLAVQYTKAREAAATEKTCRQMTAQAMATFSANTLFVFILKFWNNQESVLKPQIRIRIFFIMMSASCITAK